MFRRMMLLGIVLALVAGLSLVATSVPPVGGVPHALAAGSGNSGAPHACQNGGYANLIGTNGTMDTMFTNTGGCLSYAAHGGMLVSLAAAQPCLNGGWQTLTSASGQPAFSSEAACVQFVGNGGTPVSVSAEPFSVSIIGPSNGGATCDLQFTGSDLMAGATVYAMYSGGSWFAVFDATGAMTVPNSGVLNDVGAGFNNNRTAAFKVEGASGDTLIYPLNINC